MCKYCNLKEGESKILDEEKYCPECGRKLL